MTPPRRLIIRVAVVPTQFVPWPCDGGPTPCGADTVPCVDWEWWFMREGTAKLARDGHVSEKLRRQYLKKHPLYGQRRIDG